MAQSTATVPPEALCSACGPIGSVIGLLQGGAVAAGVVGLLFMGVVFDLNGDYSVAIWALIAVSAPGWSRSPLRWPRRRGSPKRAASGP